MEPFAAKSPQKSLQLHWWIIAGIGGAFFIWSLDLLPRIRSAATGVVADSSNSSGSRNDELLDQLGSIGGDWSDIEEPASSGVLPDDSDPLMMPARKKTGTADARNHQLQPQDPFNDKPVKDSSITRASYDSTDDSVENAVLSDLAESDSEISDSGNSRHEKIIPAEFAEQLRNIDQWIGEDRVLDAHAELSKLYWKYADLRSLIQGRISQTSGMIFTTKDRLFGPPHFVEYGETLETIAKQYDVPWMYLSNLNKVEPDELQAGQKLKVVRGPFGAVVDLHDFTLTIHAHGWYVNHYTIGTGKDKKTPLGEFTIKDKLENPTWYNPDGGIVEPDDPENPLGEFWLGLGDHIGIHGTNDPSTIGRAASRGCIHLNDDDIAEVYSLLSSGSKVLIRR